MRIKLITTIGLLGAMVSPTNAQPSVSRQPVDTVVPPGAIAQFSAGVSSTNPPVIYQWWFRDAALDAVANPSAATRLLSIINVTRANAGPCFVVVNGVGGAATSQVATLTVDLRSQGIWQRIARGSGASWPEARGYAHMVYDPNSGRVLLLGGESGWFGDWASHLPGNGGVWALDPVSAQWSLLCQTNPAGFVNGAAYDTKAGRLIVHVAWVPDGSSSPRLISETWAFDPATGTWENRHPTQSPPAGLDQCAQLAYHTKSDKVIMFGGWVVNNVTETGCRNTTWVYDYPANTWTNMAPKYADMAYSHAQGRIVLFGGLDYTETQINNDTWVYDYWANTWTRFTPPVSLTRRGWCAMAYSAAADAVILFGGGTDRNHFTDETWSYHLPLLATLATQPGQVVLNWNGGLPPYSAQTASDLALGNWRDVITNATPPVSLPSGQPNAFYRIVGQ
jgi:hypothetical protein